MKILTELHRRERLNIHGKAFQRTTIRGVVLHRKKLFMVRSAEVGDYRFPGGALQDDETHEQALRREIIQECGMSLRALGDEIGVVVEYNSSLEPQYEVFKMTSYYYWCQLEEVVGPQQLDDHERDFGLEPVWIHIDEAIFQNKQVLRFGKAPGWLRRELFVLEHIRSNLPRYPVGAGIV
jgi:8-oxo-dGTP pyrophosphatase MutT (NUDIX family)